MPHPSPTAAASAHPFRSPTAPHASRGFGRRLRGERGVSLIETVAALGLFGVVVASMSNFLVAQIRHASHNNLDTVAYSLAADALEDARAQVFGNLAERSNTIDKGAMTYTVTMRVQDNTPADGLKTLVAEVAWNDPNGSHAISVPAIYTEVTRF